MAPEQRWNFGQGSLVLRQGDLTLADVDALVNAANARLAGGGGVDGAIHAAAGPELLQACQDIVAAHGPLAPGKAVITPGFNCRARRIIHTVGPVWGCCSHNEPELLASCYEQSLLLAERHGLKSIAFPAVSCGAYGYPEQLAAPVALGALRQGLLEHKVETAFLYLYSHKAFEQWTSLAGRLFGPPMSETASA